MTTKEIYNFLKPFLVKERKNLVIAVSLLFISSLIGVLYGYFIGYAISSASNHAFKIAIITLLINLLLYIFNYTFLDRIGEIISQKCSLNIIKDINLVLFEKVLKLPTKAFEEKSSGEFINRVTSDSETIADALGTLLGIIIRIITNILVFVYVFINSRLVALEIVIYLIILYKFSSKFNVKLKKVQKETRKKNDEYVASVNESVHGIREIRALGINKNIISELKHTINNLFEKRYRTMKFENNYYATTYLLNELLVATVFITIIIDIYNGNDSLTFLVAMSYYVYNFIGLVNSFTRFSTYLQKLKVSVERIYEVVQNKLYKDTLFGAYHNLNPKGKLEFKDVSFMYHDQDTNILDKFNLTINPNSKIAIIGKSGQGKSTIFNLLLRYFDVTGGKILLDDVDICEYDEESLRNNISIIRQEPFLFNRSILENFKMVHSKISLKDVRKYCKIALIDDYIMSLPKKYNTIIGEGGVNLSGGQKQRLAIARALSKNSKIILFDEATSALDNESQEKIIKVINEISKDHTIITIAHRLSTIIDSDIIHVMDKGRIIESGSHKKLLKESKVYKELYKNNS